MCSPLKGQSTKAKQKRYHTRCAKPKHNRGTQVPQSWQAPHLLSIFHRPGLQGSRRWLEGHALLRLSNPFLHIPLQQSLHHVGQVMCDQNRHWTQKAMEKLVYFLFVNPSVFWPRITIYRFVMSTLWPAVVADCHFPDLDCFGSGRKEAVLGPVGGFRYQSDNLLP